MKNTSTIFRQSSNTQFVETLAKVIFTLLIKLIRICNKNHSIQIIGPDDSVYKIGKSTPNFALKIQDYSIIFHLIRNPLLAVGELYVDKRWELVKGDLVDFLGDMLILSESFQSKNLIGKCIFRIRRFMFAASQRYGITNSRKNVEVHYDIGNDWYESFLDSELNYSCADYSNGAISLDEAQKNKIQGTINRLTVDEKYRILEIGSGWGNLSRELSKIGCEIVALTLSKEQYLHSISQASSDSFSEKIDYRLEDYREFIGQNKHKFDRVVSIGMFEHVGLAQFAEFFESVKEAMTDDGQALIHTIVRKEPGVTNPWIDKYIFPGGYIVSDEEFRASLETSNLIVCENTHQFRSEDYIRTLLDWRRRLRIEWERKLHKKYSEPVLRMFEFYFAGSAAAFKYMDMHVTQYVVKKRTH